MNLKVVLSNFLFITVLFPYISVINTPFDTQPTSLLVAMFIFFVILFERNDKIPITFVPLLFLFVMSIIAMLIYPNDMISGLRSVVGYSTLFFVTLASYKTFKLINPRILIYSEWIWFIVAFIQTFISKNFGSFLLSNLRTSAARGVTSLAVEPSYYAIIMVFFLILNEFFYAKNLFNNKEYKQVFVLSCIQILLSFSGMGILFLAVFGLFKTISVVLTKNVVKKISSLIIFFSLLGTAFVAFTSIPKLAQSRAGGILVKFIQSPTDLIMSDKSIALRLSHITISTLSIFQNFGLGHGVGQFETKAISVMENLPTPIWKMIVEQEVYPGGRIMSGWGSSIFELGIIGLIPLFLFIYVMRLAMKKSNKSVYITAFGVIFILMWMSVPYSFPLFSYFMGITLFDIYDENKLGSSH
ncbi:hypothetical protein ACFXEB_09010 [Aerococcus urinaeequi]|uniref:hypothetical protein n=1 Tax=Aerococcus urinaeequi TaxID=51665 RepID=UPI00366F622D